MVRPSKPATISPLSLRAVLGQSPIAMGQHSRVSAQLQAEFPEVSQLNRRHAHVRDQLLVQTPVVFERQRVDSLLLLAFPQAFEGVIVVSADSRPLGRRHDRKRVMGTDASGKLLGDQPCCSNS